MTWPLRPRARADLPTRPIRIVFCLDSIGLGGTEMNALRVAEHLDQQEFPLTVACFRTDGALRDRFASTGATIMEFPVRSLYGRSMLSAGASFRRYLRREHIDIVHAHDRYANVFGALWGRAAGVPVVITSKRWNSISGVHGVANRLAYGLSSRVLGNSKQVGASLVATDGVDARKVVVITNFVDDDAFVTPSAEWQRATREQLRIGSDARVVGIVANLRPIKDHRTLLRAVARIAPALPNLVLVLIGEGREREPLTALADELGIASNVRFAGMYPNLPNPHSLFDVSVLTSVSEGFPNTLVEAMAAGRPVVATNTGGVADAVTEGETGLLVPVGDDAALADALRRLLTDSGLRARFGTRGEQVARERFTPAHAVGQLQQLYRDLAARPTG